MAAPVWTSAALSSDEQAWRSADKPLMAVQSIPVAPTVCRWSEIGAITSTDRTATGYPTSRAFDGKPHLVTKPDTTVSNNWYLTFDFGKGIEFDSLFIIGHNFGTLGLLGVTLEIDDGNPNPGDTPDGTFTNTKVVGSITSFPDDTRLIDGVLKHTGSDPLRYSDVQYARLRMAKGSAITPQLGQVYFARRYQLQYKPNLEFDPDNLQIDNDIIKSRGGVKSKYVHSMGEYDLSASFTPDDSSRITDFINFYKADYGRRPFIWSYDPSTDSDGWRLMVLESALNTPMVNSSQRKISIEATEQGPERFYLAREGV